MGKQMRQQVVEGWHDFGEALQAQKLASYGCAGEMECVHPYDGNCACFNVTLARYMFDGLDLPVPSTHDADVPR